MLSCVCKVGLQKSSNQFIGSVGFSSKPQGLIVSRVHQVVFKILNPPFRHMGFPLRPKGLTVAFAKWIFKDLRTIFYPCGFPVQAKRPKSHRRSQGGLQMLSHIFRHLGSNTGPRKRPMGSRIRN